MVSKKKQKQEEVNPEEQVNKAFDKRSPWWFEKGKSGNPGGRPKGSISLKTWAKNYLASLNEEERFEFISGLPKELIWKMGEGNPKQDTELSGNLTISEVLDQLENGPEIEGQDMAG